MYTSSWDRHGVSHDVTEVMESELAGAEETLGAWAIIRHNTGRANRH